MFGGLIGAFRRVIVIAAFASTRFELVLSYRLMAVSRPERRVNEHPVLGMKKLRKSTQKMRSIEEITALMRGL